MQHLKPRDLTAQELAAQIELTSEKVVEVDQRYKANRQAVSILIDTGRWQLGHYFPNSVFLRRIA